MNVHRAIACLLGLLLALQPAFAAGSPRCSHQGGHDHAAMAHAQHHGHHGMSHGDGDHGQSPERCDCGCRGAMAGCAHAGQGAAMGADLQVAARIAISEAPALLCASPPSPVRSEPPLRPPTLA